MFCGLHVQPNIFLIPEAGLPPSDIVHIPALHHSKNILMLRQYAVRTTALILGTITYVCEKIKAFLVFIHKINLDRNNLQAVLLV